MTQSGQGEEPSARPAHEGIVLPSDGGEPLLPGMASAPAPAPAAPTGGQAWGGTWGPGAQQAPQPDQGWPPAAAQQWGTPDQQPAGNGPGPLPPEGAPAPSYGGQAYGSAGQAQAYGGDQQQYGAGQQHQYGGGQQPQGDAGRSPAYGAPDPYRQQYPASPAPSAPLPPADAYAAHGAAAQGATLPPAVPEAYPAASLPPTADGATQYIPPVTGGAAPMPGLAAAPASVDEGATQYLPPVPAAPVDEGATQYIPPVAPGALPPESAGEETRFLGRVPQPAAPSDADATQYIPPFTGQAPGGDRQPPAEFDNLFRGGPGGGESPAGSTQQMPRIQPNGYPGPAQPSYIQPIDMDEDDGGRRGGRTGSRVPLIAAVGVGIIIVGFGVGAMFSGGGGDEGNDKKTVAAASPATQDSASAAADPAQQQAAALDKLLADSGSSRASVIQAVANVRRCNNLGQSASDLRDAAKQRADLVARLGKLSVDKLPNNAALTAALTKAWQASAAADNHYAAWADQVGGGRKGCHKGQARGTAQTQAGNRESGTASAQKVKAAALWNTIAQKYGLTQRQPTQL
ncbi:hypothetical protein [Streptomyces sp. NPDC017958]|uniref:hypothetical protein n=1 Tax=Streptomyces sp. NPDC017958 TaxID=3365021 RepID=UPI0037A7FEBB